MPYKPSTSIKMDLSHGNNSIYKQLMISNLVKSQEIEQRKAPSALNSGMINRIHNVRPGCSSCGK
jgi:hypothetical protein